MSSSAMDVGAGLAQQRRLSPSPLTTASATASGASPSSPSPSSPSSPTSPTFSTDKTLYPDGSRSLAGIALRAFCLGAAAVLGLLLSLLLLLLPRLTSLAPLWRLPFFLAALAVFHFLEFYTTAAYNTPAASVDAFLLTANWPGYAIAHAAAVAECLLRFALFGAGGVSGLATAWPLTLALGLAAVAGGQAVRSAAMVHAGRSFNHQVQRQRASGHSLVTTGIYAHLRHPSYFGFFWWALGTQLVLGNTICLAGYAAVLWRFFSLRIRHEEHHLVRFFGDEYEAYRQRVGTKMLFI